MRIRGRGVRISKKTMAWHFHLDEEGGSLKGELQVDGWERSGEMNQWFEKNHGEEVEMVLEGLGRVRLTPRGIHIHESGHHNESVVKVEGFLLETLKGDEDPRLI